MAANEIMAPSVNTNCQYSTRYCWEAEKVKSLIRLRAELSPLFTGKRNASKYAWAVVERELNVPLPLSKIIKKWNNLLQEYKAIKMSEEPKRREWPFFTLMDVYFSDQVNDPSLRLFSSTKTLKETIDDSVFEDDPIISSAIAAATSGAFMDMDELIRRQKERAAERNKYAVAAGGGGNGGSDFKYDIKPMLPNSKFNNSSEMVKLSKSVDDLTMQQFKLKEELLRQRDQEQQENIAKIKQHARQQQQQQQQAQQQQQHQQQQQQQQQQQHQRFHHQQHQAQQPPLSPHPHSRMAQSATPPALQHALQQQQQHMLQQRHLQQLQQHHQQQHQQQQQQQQPHQPPPLPAPPRPSSPPTTAQQIHITTAQHQAAQQQLHQQQQQQQPQQQQQQTYTDPNTIDQYLLSWNNFHGNMCRGFHTLQKDEKMVDVTIAAGGKIFKAHKLVLSVCSPYFQQIFLENPSSHPILLMADVEASHMAGLLDFMYSGQVNVKYEDLPVFLKVAEAMKIKGLHTEKNMDSDASDISSPHESESTECRYERGTHSVNITSGHGYGGLAHLAKQQQQQQQQQSHDSNLNGPNNSAGGSNRSSTPLPMPGYAGFREHIKSKATLAETFMKNLNRNNNNSSNNNFNQLTNPATNGPSTASSAGGAVAAAAATTEPLPSENYSIMQANSKKMLDTARKQHKYLAKRKILMHYNDELNEKRMKEMDTERYGTDHEEHGEHNPDALDTPMTIVPQQQQQQQQHNNNFRIRLVEKHQQHNNSSNNNNNTNTDNSNNEHENNNNNNNNKNNNNNSSHEPMEEQEEEALNLVQTPCNAEPTRATSSETPNLHLVKQEFDASEMAQDMTQEHSSGNGHDEHLAAYEQRSGKYDDNNNNKDHDHDDDDDETDNNNNSNSNKNSSHLDGQQMHLSKNAALLSVINRNMEQEHQQQQQQQQQETTATTTAAGDLDNDNNNNNQSQLDLSTIKNIATAEILCGLKSKVLKMEEERERERERARERERERESCRSLSEIKNAD